MPKINIKPVEILGDCPADLQFEDVVHIEGMNLNNPRGKNICFLALTHFPIMIWQLQSEERFFSHASCPGCISQLDQENRVVFLLGHADKWDLCQLISKYLRLCKEHEETQPASTLKTEAIELQNQGKFAEAALKMKKAVEIMQRAAES